MNKKFFNALALLMLLVLPGYAQYVAPGSWGWVDGSDTTQKRGVYRTMGVANPVSDPGGREGGATWTDSAGNFWVYGGWSYATSTVIASVVNDLWKYDPVAGDWTWVRGDTVTNRTGIYGVKGTPAPANQPGARQRFPHWTDTNGDFWLFGGYGMGASTPLGNLNDLWKYTVATGEWTYVSGGTTRNINGIYGTKRVSAWTNMPGGRDGAAGWCDKQGNFWIFGGIGKYANAPAGTNVWHLNDMWKFDPVSEEWTWVAGSDTADRRSTSGPQGTADTANTPGARRYATTWTDSAGNLWLFGGQRGFGTATTVYKYNDLWKFDPVNEAWTWVSGDTMATHNDGSEGGHSVYGTLLVADTNNHPGARSGAVGYPGPDGYFWLFGGSGAGSSGTGGYLNDLWLYNYVTNEWTWVHGDSTPAAAQHGNYGTLGVSDPANTPAGRYFGHGKWVTPDGDLWLYGGHGRARNASGQGYMNDMWRFSTCFILGTGSDISGNDTICRETVQTYSIPSITNAESYTWEIPADWTGSSTTNTITVTAGTTGGTISVRATNYCDSGDVRTLDVFIPPANQVMIEVDSYTLATSRAFVTYQWYLNGDSIPGATDSFLVVDQNGDYVVAVTDIYGCGDSSRVYIVNNVSVPAVDGNEARVSVYPNPARAAVYVRTTTPAAVVLRSLDGRTVLRQSSAGTVDISGLAAGVYLIQVTGSDGRLLHMEKLVKTSGW